MFATLAPCPKGFYKSSQEYWSVVEPLRTSEGLPEWAFDFISIHASVGRDGKKEHSLLGPSRLVVNEKRPAFEKETFKTLTDAKKAAARVAKRLGFSVVVCIPER